MRAGPLNKLVTLQQKTAGGADDWGIPIAPWVTVRQVYASIEPSGSATMRGAADSIMAGAQVAYDLVDIQMHPAPDVLPISWRVLYNAKTYVIQASRLNNKSDRTILIATVGAVDG